MSRTLRYSIPLLVVVLAASCGGPVNVPTDDAGLLDAGSEDAGDTRDSGLADAGMVDAGSDDAGLPDAGPDVDAGADDAGLLDAGPDVDAGVADAGADAGSVDAGNTDAGVDAGALDGGVNDAGTADGGVDAGQPDAGPPIATTAWGLGTFVLTDGTCQARAMLDDGLAGGRLECLGATCTCKHISGLGGNTVVVVATPPNTVTSCTEAGTAAVWAACGFPVRTLMPGCSVADPPPEWPVASNGGAGCGCRPLNAPCTSGADCASGMCFNRGDLGHLCAEACTVSCACGLACRQWFPGHSVCSPF